MSRPSILTRIRRNVGLRPLLRERLLFLHVPKCGGTSVFHAIKKAYGLRAYLEGGRFQKLDNGASLRAAAASGRDVHELRNDVLRYFLETRAYFVYGHFRLPPADAREALEGWSKVTMLRDPVDRWFSHYFFHAGIDSGDPTDPAALLRSKLERFLDTQPERAVAMGSIYETCFTELGEAPDAERALRNLGAFDVVGRVEDPGAFEAAFRRRFGVPLRIPRLNPGRRVPLARARETFGDELVDRVEACCAGSRRVYDALFQGAT